MICVLYNQEPFALVQNMRSYFKCNPPDCRIISQDNLIHKELLYPTEVLCEMVRSADIDILCPDRKPNMFQNHTAAINNVLLTSIDNNVEIVGLFVHVFCVT